MSLSKDIEKKLISENLTKKERQTLKQMKNIVNEAPIDYEGPERMEPGIERQITQKQTPFHGHPSVPEQDRDFIELVASKRFKDSVDKVKRYLGDDSGVLQSRNPLMQLMSMGMNGMRKIAEIEQQNKQYLENLAIDLFTKEKKIPKDKFQFKVTLGGTIPQEAKSKMRSKPEQPKKEDIEKIFKKSQKHTEELEDFTDAMEKFNLEKAKRKFINSLIQGSAFKSGHMYFFIQDEINRLDPELMELYGVTQSILEHLYWLYPNMEGMAAGSGGGGGGQLAQGWCNTKTSPPTITAAAPILPLLLHEMDKAFMDCIATHGFESPEQAKMVMGAEDTLPGEIWDSRLGPVFYEKFRAAFPERLFDEDKAEIQNYLFHKFVKISAPEFVKLAKAILKGEPSAMKAVDKMVSEIETMLRKKGMK
jgi:hypothetical protein